MKLKILLFFSSVITIGMFTIFSYTVAKEYWQQIDFDTTVKLQDHIPARFNSPFSIFSLIGSAEVTVIITAVFAVISLLKRRVLALVGWFMIVPATIIEVFGKLVLFHPGTPVFLHRSVNLGTTLPSFYIHTNFSYPSGHMTRTVFLITILFLLTLVYIKNLYVKVFCILLLIGFGFMMAVTRVYLGEHWLSDVIGGSLLGVSAGLFGAIFIIKDKTEVLQAN